MVYILKDAQPSNATTVTYIRNDSNHTKSGITFTSSSAYSLGKISVLLTKVGSPTGSIYLTIYAADANKRPTGSILGTSTSMSIADISTTATKYDFTFNTVVSISNATQYVIVFEADNTINSSNYILIRGANISGQNTPIYNGSAWSDDSLNYTGVYDIYAYYAKGDTILEPDYRYYGHDGNQGSPLTVTVKALRKGIFTKIMSSLSVGSASVTVAIKDGSSNTLASKTVSSGTNVNTTTFILSDYTREINANETISIVFTASSGGIYAKTGLSFSGNGWEYTSQTVPREYGQVENIYSYTEPATTYAGILFCGGTL